MGYGEFGGGGSVQWQMIYDDPQEPGKVPGKNPVGKKRQAFGHDDAAGTNPGDKLYVVVTDGKLLQLMPGVIVVEVTLKKDKDDQVVLRWGSDATAELKNLSTAPASGV